MGKNCVLISGPTVAANDELINEFQKNSIVLKDEDYSRIRSIIEDDKDKGVDLIFLEIPRNDPSKVKYVDRVKKKHSKIKVVVMNGDNLTIIKAFKYKATEAFRIEEYEKFIKIIVQRVNIILNNMAEEKNVRYWNTSERRVK